MAWTWEQLAGPATITEGPVWDGTGLWYTSIDDNEIRRYDPTSGAIVVIYRDTGGANGLAFDPTGRLYACAGTARQMTRYETDGTKTVLAERFNRARLNSPNDVVVDRAGRVWFTDPRYGSQEGRDLDHDSVYRLTAPTDDGDAWAIERLTVDTTRPNGLLLSADERTLYVAQSDYDGPRQLRAYPVRDDGTLGAYQVLHDFGHARGIDGMRLDTDGNIIATCGWELSGPGPRIAVFAPDGTVIAEHPVPEGRPTNCAFGGADLSDLYVTTMSGHLYRVRNSGHRGALQPPPARPHRG